VVAPLGTALTPGHVSLLSRYSRNFTVLFDGDEAGVKAAQRALGIFIDAGLMPRVVILPQEEDPDTFVRKFGVEAMKEKLSKAPSLFDFFVDATSKLYGNDALGKANTLRDVTPVLGRISDGTERALYKRSLARRLDIDENSIGVAGPKAVKSGEVMKVSVKKTRVDNADSLAERNLVHAMLVNTNKISEVLEKLTPEDFKDEWFKTIAVLLYNEMQRNGKVNVSALIEDLEDDELKMALRAVALEADLFEDEEIDELVRDCVMLIKERPMETRLEDLNEGIKNAQRENDEARVMSLLNEKQKLIQQMRGK
jgi:DNA primase